ncbi:MAG: hypothetical protein RL885_21270 [Planctomycetota bacterium]
MNRRQLLAGLGTVAAGASLSVLTPRGITAPFDGTLSDLAARLRSASREGALSIATSAIANGASREALLGAIFLAGVQDIRPRPHGILHSVMMVESAFQLSESMRSPRESWHPVLFNLDDFKRSQERDRDEDGDYQMKPLTVFPAKSGAAGFRALEESLVARDPDRAERAVVALAPHIDVGTFFEWLRPFSARCYAFIGHKIIYAMQVERVIRRIGWPGAEPALRSLMRTLLVDSNPASFERNSELAADLPEDWQAGSRNPARAHQLWRSLRRAEPKRAPSVTCEALRDGVSATDAFDALALLGSEIFHHRPGRRSADGRSALLPVHGLTVANAFRSSFLQSEHDATRRVLLLQASAWVTSLRDDLGPMVGLDLDGPSLGSAETEDDVDAPSVLRSGSPDRVFSVLQSNTDAAPEIMSSLTSSLARNGREHHQHKYAAAVLEECHRVAPDLRAYLIAPAADYLAHPADEPTELYLRSELALEKAGIPR